MAFFITTPARTPASLIADMLDNLASCITEAQLRAWLSTTAEFRQNLPQMLLERVEAARLFQERNVERYRPRARVTGAARHGQCDGDPLLVDIRKALNATSMSPATFGRQAVNDPSLVLDMARGRRLTGKTEGRVRAFLATMEAR